jgi:hypothetical protein
MQYEVVIGQYDVRVAHYWFLESSILDFTLPDVEEGVFSDYFSCQWHAINHLRGRRAWRN